MFGKSKSFGARLFVAAITIAAFAAASPLTALASNPGGGGGGP